MEDFEHDLIWVLGFRRIALITVLRLHCKGARAETGRPVRRLLQWSWQEKAAP